MTSQITYLGDLRTVSKHILSGNEILSDAPLDNNGKGEAFSPTDLVANAAGSCMLTIIGIKARDLDLNIDGSIVEVTKIMQAEPRKISRIELIVKMSLATSDKNKVILERTALNCPVLLSLNPDIEKDITIIWKD